MGLGKSVNINDRVELAKELMRGIKSKTDEVNSNIVGGQTVMNPWFMIGGTAITTVSNNDILLPRNFEHGDTLILTKPLGTNISVRLNDYKNENKIEIDDELSNKITNNAIKYMTQLNLYAAKLFKTYEIKGATDITGFGLLGHANNLLNEQDKNVMFKIHSIPIIEDLKD